MPTFSKRTKVERAFRAAAPRRASGRVPRRNIARCGRARPACANAAGAPVVDDGGWSWRHQARAAATPLMLDDCLLITCEIQVPCIGATPIRCVLPAKLIDGTSPARDCCDASSSTMGLPPCRCRFGLKYNRIGTYRQDDSCNDKAFTVTEAGGEAIHLG